MLAASAVGTVDFRSICEPIRNVNPLVNYIEAAASSIDAKKRTIACQSIKCEGTSCEIADFSVPYDFLIIAVGATTNTFGIKGVVENCLFLKQIEDAANLRKGHKIVVDCVKAKSWKWMCLTIAIANCFERANVPNLSDEEIEDALSFVVVGAGPTGVEFTSELRDWIEVEGAFITLTLFKLVDFSWLELKIMSIRFIIRKKVLRAPAEACQDNFGGSWQCCVGSVRRGFAKGSSQAAHW